MAHQVIEQSEFERSSSICGRHGVQRATSGRVQIADAQHRFLLRGSRRSSTSMRAAISSGANGLVMYHRRRAQRESLIDIAQRAEHEHRRAHAASRSRFTSVSPSSSGSMRSSVMTS